MDDPPASTPSIASSPATPTAGLRSPPPSPPPKLPDTAASAKKSSAEPEKEDGDPSGGGWEGGMGGEVALASAFSSRDNDDIHYQTGGDKRDEEKGEKRS